MSKASKLVERVTARVFGTGKASSGNPVTIFASQNPLSQRELTGLVQNCPSHSIVVSTSTHHKKKEQGDVDIPQFQFFLPNGRPTLFTSHAALGAATVVSQSMGLDQVTFQVPKTLEDNDTTIQHTVQLIPSKDTDETSPSITAKLIMETTTWEDTAVSQPPSLQRLLRGHLGLASSFLHPVGRRYPTFRNISIGSYSTTTLVHVNDPAGLSSMKLPNPSVIVASPPSKEKGGGSAGDASSTPPPRLRNTFSMACKSIDNATGLLLYANRKHEPDSWDCRSFLGATLENHEDPASGLAAAALVGTLYEDGVYAPCYNMYFASATDVATGSSDSDSDNATSANTCHVQVLDFVLQNNQVSFGLQGRVDVDHRDTLTIPEQLPVD